MVGASLALSSRLSERDGVVSRLWPRQARVVACRKTQRGEAGNTAKTAVRFVCFLYLRCPQ